MEIYTKMEHAGCSLKLQTPHGKMYVQLPSIVRIESQSNYSKIIFCDNSVLIVAKVLSWFAKALDGENFTRIHRSHIVNKRYVAKHYVNRVRLTNGDEVSISRRRQSYINTLPLTGVA